MRQREKKNSELHPANRLFPIRIMINPMTSLGTRSIIYERSKNIIVMTV